MGMTQSLPLRMPQSYREFRKTRVRAPHDTFQIEWCRGASVSTEDRPRDASRASGVMVGGQKDCFWWRYAKAEAGSEWGGFPCQNSNLLQGWLYSPAPSAHSMHTCSPVKQSPWRQAGPSHHWHKGPGGIWRTVWPWTPVLPLSSANRAGDMALPLSSAPRPGNMHSLDKENMLALSSKPMCIWHGKNLPLIIFIVLLGNGIEFSARSTCRTCTQGGTVTINVESAVWSHYASDWCASRQGLAPWWKPQIGHKDAAWGECSISYWE